MTRKEQVALWDAINRYSATCGGDPSAHTMSAMRESAVVAIESLIAAIERAAVHRATGDALNSGSGVYKP